MSFIFKRGPVWWYYWSTDGRKFGKSLKTDDKETAEVLKGEEDKTRLLTGIGLPSPTSRWKKFHDEYLDYCKTKGAATHKRDERALDAFVSTVKPTLFKDISQRVIEVYLTKIANATSKGNANVNYRHLKAAFSKAVEWSYLPKSPFVGVSQYRLDKKAPRFLSKEEIVEMLSKARKDPHPASYGLAMAFLWTGMRLAEVLALKWEDIDFERGWIKAFGKGRKERPIPLHPRLDAALLAFRRHQGFVFGTEKAMSLDTVQHIFRDRLLPPGASIHTLRHTFASHAVMSGMDLKTLQEILGHTTITTTMIYSHLSRPHIKEGMEKVTLQ